MTLTEAIEKGKEFIKGYQMACLAGDRNLMEIIRRKRAAFEISIMREYGDDFMSEYYSTPINKVSIDQLDEFNANYLK